MFPGRRRREDHSAPRSGESSATRIATQSIRKVFSARAGVKAGAALTAFLAAACAWRSPSAPRVPLPAPPADEEESARAAISFLERRVREDPEDFTAWNRLAERYLERVRRTGDHRQIPLAEKAALASLAAAPAERNLTGLAALCRAKAAAHDFSASRDLARQLLRLDAQRSDFWGLLGDALLEAGEEREAGEAYRRMAALGGSTVASETRLARLAFLTGKTREARRRLATALHRALASFPPAREPAGWCLWQLGEIAFLEGRYAESERYDTDALATAPWSLAALASLARARAALGDFEQGITLYERAVARDPAPIFLASLSDLELLAGRGMERAERLLRRLEEPPANPLDDALDSRQIAVIWADHDRRPQEAFARASHEYQRRRDIYGADALAWTALKAGRLGSAEAAIKEALRLKTRDPRLLYHAGMIEQALGRCASARRLLQRALRLSPRFDPLQSRRARLALEGLGRGAEACRSATPGQGVRLP